VYIDKINLNFEINIFWNFPIVLDSTRNICNIITCKTLHTAVNNVKHNVLHFVSYNFRAYIYDIYEWMGGTDWESSPKLHVAFEDETIAFET